MINLALIIKSIISIIESVFVNSVTSILINALNPKTYFEKIVRESYAKRIFGTNPDIVLYYGSTTVSSFYVNEDTKNKVIPPGNVKLIGLGDGLALGDAALRIKRDFGKNVSILSSSAYEPALNKSMISIGGGSVNKVTNKLLGSSNISIDKEIEVVYPDHYLLEQSKRYTPTIKQGMLHDDYGVIVIHHSENSNKSIILVFGVWPPGTQAALRMLLNPTKEFRKLVTPLIKKKQGCVSVIKTPVLATTDDAIAPGREYYKIVSVRELRK